MFLFHVNLSAYVDSPHFIISNVLLSNLKIPAIIGMPYVKVYETEREIERMVLCVWPCVFDEWSSIQFLFMFAWFYSVCLTNLWKRNLVSGE